MKIGAEIIEAIMASGIKEIKNFNSNGTSMLPLLHNSGDAVTLIQPENIKLNDIVLYKRANGEFVLHRIVRIYERNYGLCGDNTFAIEQGISDEDIVAKVSEINRNGKLISLNSNKLYKLYSFVWVHTLPLRRLIHNLHYKINRQEETHCKYIIAILKKRKKFLFKENYFDGFISSDKSISPSFSKAITFSSEEEAYSILEKCNIKNAKVYPINAAATK